MSHTALASNPILDRGVADPFIVVANDWYYLYGTGKAEDGRFLPIYRSRDLVAWEFVRGAVEQGAEGAWNRRNFWAPEVLCDEGKYYLYYTASVDGTPGNTGNRVGLAEADRPDGPFADHGVVIAHSSLDGSPFRDSDGRLYLYYTVEFGNADGFAPGRILVDRLRAPDRVEGKPKELITHYSWQEGPVVLRREGRCFLFYSTGNYGDATYAVRWAVSDSPLGPFAESPTALLESNEQVIGPGHNNFFTAGDGSEWIVYHGWDFAHRARFPRIDRLEWRDGAPYVEGPTYLPRPLPPPL